jgi:hypothetical protein
LIVVVGLSDLIAGALRHPRYGTAIVSDRIAWCRRKTLS